MKRHNIYSAEIKEIGYTNLLFFTNFNKALWLYHMILRYGNFSNEYYDRYVGVTSNF